MAGETGLSDVNGINKRVYDKSGLAKATLGIDYLQREISWGNGTRNIGESYQVGVVLRPPNGFTHPVAGTPSTLKQGRPMKIQQASLTPFEIDLREQYAWAALSRASEQGEGAMAALVGEIYKAMKEQTQNRVEAVMLHGQRTEGLGIVEAVTDLGGGSADITITVATWAPGLWWALNEGTTLDSFTSTTKNNASGALVVSGVKASERKVTVTYTGTLASEVAAADTLHFEGSWDGTTYTEMPGLILQNSNLTGTSCGLSATTYSNWKANQYNVAGNIGAGIVEDAVGQLRDRGAKQKLRMLVCNKGFSALMSEQMTQRVFDSSYSPEKAKVNTKAVTFETPDVGEIELVNHPFMFWGDFLLFNPGDCGRIGSADIMFGVPGSDVDAPVWERVPNTTAAEVVLFTDQAVIQKYPKNGMWGYGITY